MRWKWFFIAPAALLGLVVFVFLGGEIVMQLWNWVLPPIFGWREVTFWQALGLLALCRILVGGFGLRGGRGPQWRSRGRMADRIADRIVDRVAERWDTMTPEQRERFRQRIHERCGFDPAAGERKEPSSA